jgi:hypothetical protein
MGTVFEQLIRRFNEAINENPGEHFTPRDPARRSTRPFRSGTRRSRSAATRPASQGRSRSSATPRASPCLRATISRTPRACRPACVPSSAAR